jgi:hypothetical protein
MIHQAESLSIAARGGHSEIPRHVLFRVPSLLMSDQHHGAIAQAANASDQSLIVTAPPVTMKLDPVVAQSSGCNPECWGGGDDAPLCIF